MEFGSRVLGCLNSFKGCGFYARQIFCVFRMSKVVCTALLLLHLLIGHAEAKEIYASVGSNGTIIWSTRPTEMHQRPVLTTPSQVSEVTQERVAAPEQFRVTNDDRRREALEPLVREIAKAHGVDPRLVLGLIDVESRFMTSAISPKGARGLMQLMPATARQYGMRDVAELHDPRRNVDIGVRHLRDLLQAHGNNWTLTLAAYNAGSGAVQRHGRRVPGYSETMLYVPSVLLRATSLPTSQP